MSFRNNSKQTQKQNGGGGFRTKLNHLHGFKKEYYKSLGRYIVKNDKTKPFEFKIKHDWKKEVSDDLNKFVKFILDNHST